jgi:hypothetical protein
MPYSMISKATLKQLGFGIAISMLEGCAALVFRAQKIIT